MPLSDPVDDSIIVEYDPFEDKADQAPINSPSPMTEHQKSRDSDLSSSPKTPLSAGDGPHFQHHDGWDQFDGPIYCNVESQYKGAFGTSDNHYAAAAGKPGAASHPHPNGTTPKNGNTPLKYEPRTHAVNGDYDPLTVCDDCTAHQRAGAAHIDIEHRADAIHQFSNNVIDKVVAVEKELGVTIVHLVHEGTSWIRRGHHHGTVDRKQESKPHGFEPADGNALQRNVPVHGQ
ncbi:hypothetical protein MMC34_001663 [Xylographa carneopallida]|nr:hypothetical protein [Xylographa carneopallida]